MSALSEVPRPGREVSPQVPEVPEQPVPAEAPAALAEGRITLLGQIVGSSNATFLVRLEGEADDASDPDGVDPDDDAPGHGLFAGITPADGLHAVYKPERGERPLHDFPPGLFRRERAAHLLSRHLGWDLVPPRH